MVAASRRATYADVLAAPEDMVAEVLDGQLHLQPRPKRRHTRSASALGAFLVSAFDLGMTGPGGWIILFEPELHLGSDPDIVVPDLAGYREDRFPGRLDDDDAFLTVPPDWVCEILSDGTARIDRVKKVPIYAREGTKHLWMGDPRDRTVEVLELREGAYVMRETWASETGDEGEPARLEPFGALPIPPAAFWGRTPRAR